MFEKIKKKYNKTYNKVLENISSFHDEIKNSKDKILCKIINRNISKETTWEDEETLIQQWLSDNEKNLNFLNI